MTRMGAHIEIMPDTRQLLDIYRAEQGLKSYDRAIFQLLERESEADKC